MALTPQNDPGPGTANVTAPTILQGARRNTSLDTRAGSRSWFRGCDAPHGWPRTCSPLYDPAAEKEMACEIEVREFEGFDFYSLDFDCLDVDGGSAEALQNVRDITEQASAFMLGQELDSAPLTGNDSLQSVAQELNPGATPAHPKDALAMLLHAAADVGITSGTVVIPFHALPAFRDSLDFVNGQYRVHGFPVLTGPGISGNGPNGAGSNDVAYIYIIRGTVDYNLSETDFSDIGLTGVVTTERMNQFLVESLRSGIVRFNPLCVWTVAACIKHEACCDAPAAPLEATASEAVEAAARSRENARQATLDAIAERKASKAEGVAKARAKVEAERNAKAKKAIAAEPKPAELPTAGDLIEMPAVIADGTTATQAGIADGTIAEVLERVGNSPELAIEALHAEAQGRNRSTLISQLDEITHANTEE